MAWLALGMVLLSDGLYLGAEIAYEFHWLTQGAEVIDFVKAIFTQHLYTFVIGLLNSARWVLFGMALGWGLSHAPTRKNINQG